MDKSTLGELVVSIKVLLDSNSDIVRWMSLTLNFNTRLSDVKNSFSDGIVITTNEDTIIHIDYEDDVTTLEDTLIN